MSRRCVFVRRLLGCFGGVLLSIVLVLVGVIIADICAVAARGGVEASLLRGRERTFLLN